MAERKQRDCIDLSLYLPSRALSRLRFVLWEDCCRSNYFHRYRRRRRRWLSKTVSHHWICRPTCKRRTLIKQLIARRPLITLPLSVFAVHLKPNLPEPFLVCKSIGLTINHFSYLSRKLTENRKVVENIIRSFRVNKRLFSAGRRLRNQFHDHLFPKATSNEGKKKKLPKVNKVHRIANYTYSDAHEQHKCDTATSRRPELPCCNGDAQEDWCDKSGSSSTCTSADRPKGQVISRGEHYCELCALAYGR